MLKHCIDPSPVYSLLSTSEDHEKGLGDAVTLQPCCPVRAQLGSSLTAQLSEPPLIRIAARSPPVRRYRRFGRRRVTSHTGAVSCRAAAEPGCSSPAEYLSAGQQAVSTILWRGAELNLAMVAECYTLTENDFLKSY